MSFNSITSILKNQQLFFDENNVVISLDLKNSHLVSIETKISRVRSLDHRAFRLFELIYNMIMSGNRVYAAHDWFAKKLSCTRRWVIKILFRLRRMGLLFWQSGKETYRSNVYHLAETLKKSEAIRRLKDLFIGAQLAWGRLIYQYTIQSKTTEQFTPIRSYIFKSECISVEVKKHYTFSQKNQGRVRMQYQNAKVYEDFENNHGFTFTPNSKIALDGFDSETVKQSLLQAKRLDKVNFGYIIGTCNGKYKDANRKPERTHLSLLRNHLGVDENDDKTIGYDPASDNYREKTHSNGKAQGGRGLVETQRTDEYIWYRTPSGETLKFRNFYNKDGSLRPIYPVCE